MSSGDKTSGDYSGSKSYGPGSCLRPGIPESDTGESGEESEPTYRHYDNFETDVCLTQDEDDEPDDPTNDVIQRVGHNIGKGVPSVSSSSSLPSAVGILSKLVNGGKQTPPPQRDVSATRQSAGPSAIAASREPGLSPLLATGPRGVSSDSDSCTESEITQGQGQATDDTTTTTETSESEETQIWVPVGRRSSRQIVDTTTTPPASSNGSDGSRPQSYVQKAGSPGPMGVVSAGGSLTYVGTPTGTVQLDRSGRGTGRTGRAGSSDSATGRRRDSRDSWQTLQSNLQSSGVQKRVSPSKQIGVGMLRHDEATGTITLDIRNLGNGEFGLGQDTDGVVHSDDAVIIGGNNTSLVRVRMAQRQQQTTFAQLSFKESVCLLCSAFYMLFVVVAGLIVPVSEIYAQEACPVLFEGFYIYLFFLSIAFLTYVYTFLLRIRAAPLRRRSRTVVSSVPVQTRRCVISGVDEEQTGSFYLRLGAVGFSIGSLIKSGLHFGEYFEMSPSSGCDHILFAIRPILHICFTFTQLYFVFLNSKMMTRKYKYLARFGLMHMVATNMCVLFNDVIKETLRELRVANDNAEQRNMSTAASLLPSGYHGHGCYGDSLMGDVVGKASPYLYPCSVLYSIICACILFVMWSKLGDKDNKPEQEVDESRSKERSHVDCSNSSRGLFLGIIVLVAVVIMLITFFVLVRTVEFMDSAVRLHHLGDVAIFVLMTISVILSFHRTHGMRFNDKDGGPGFEEALLIISLIGVYIFCASNILAGTLTDAVRYGHLIILSNALRVIQGTVQTVYLLITMHKLVWKRDQAEKKRGREFVTFLLICNIALWGVNLFEVQRIEATPVQTMFYGPVTWNIITHLTLPLAILFRFHSTVCLANIWKHAWKLRN